MPRPRAVGAGSDALPSTAITHCRLCGYALHWHERIHRECRLREVMGGIGHLIAHDYWCAGGASGLNDPDAGLSYRQSALLVDAYCNIVGIGDDMPGPD